LERTTRNCEAEPRTTAGPTKRASSARCQRCPTGPPKKTHLSCLLFPFSGGGKNQNNTNDDDRSLRHHGGQLRLPRPRVCLPPGRRPADGRRGDLPRGRRLLRAAAGAVAAAVRAGHADADDSARDRTAGPDAAPGAKRALGWIGRRETKEREGDTNFDSDTCLFSGGKNINRHRDPLPLPPSSAPSASSPSPPRRSPSQTAPSCPATPVARPPRTSTRRARCRST